MVNRYKGPVADKPADYKMLEDWARGEHPNRAGRRQMMKRLGMMSGLQGRGGRLQTPARYNPAAQARFDLTRQVAQAIEDEDRVRTAEAAMLAALEAELEDE